MNRDLGDERREYGGDKLKISELPSDPLTLFTQWIEQALASGNPDPTAMTLSTVDSKGQPSSRIVLLKQLNGNRLVFYTNYNSRKSREIGANAQVAAHFFWPELERQVKIAGIAIRMNAAESDDYFKSRPYDSKIAAWASPQSECIPDREYLENAFKQNMEKFGKSNEIPRPPHWGGYAILPSRMEFWQGGTKRLHDCIEYIKEKGGWTFRRLAP